MSPDAIAFRTHLRRWFRKHGRTLPWRDKPDPYAVLVSEFMLQQTTVAAVLPKFTLWMRAFPTLEALAKSPEARVLKLWEGLGYYSRARNLRRAAVQIVESHDGQVPSDAATLRSLPGVGSYTCAAIQAFAFDTPVVVLDANIERVIARLGNVLGNIKTEAVRSKLAHSMEHLLPASGGRWFVSALMDLGASICRSGTPDCHRCPVKAFCRAKDPSRIPMKKRPSKKVEQVESRAISVRGKSLFLQKSAGPRWSGLWLLPETKPDGPPVLTLHHVLTHHRITLHLYQRHPSRAWKAFPMDALPAMPTPHRTAISRVLSLRTSPESRV